MPRFVNGTSTLHSGETCFLKNTNDALLVYDCNNDNNL